MAESLYRELGEREALNFCEWTSNKFMTILCVLGKTGMFFGVIGVFV